MRKALFAFCFLLSFSGSIAQDAFKETAEFGLKKGVGFIIPHSPSMLYFAQQHIQKIEFYAERQTTGRKKWHQYHGFPKIGLSFSYFDLNHSALGKAYSVSPHINFDLIENNKFRLGIKPAIGLGYVSRTFDATDNFKNSAIGSHLNIFVSVLLESEVALSEHFSLLSGVNISHFSNTSFKTPNLGINLPTFELGVKYRVNRIEKEKKPIEAFQQSKAIWNLKYGLGLNENITPNEKRFVAHTFHLQAEKQYSHKGSYGASADVFYNNAHVETLESDSVSGNLNIKNIQFGISAMYFIHFEKFKPYIQAGIYLKNENEELGNLYQIVGVNYNFTPKLGGIIAFKTHNVTAEFIQLGLFYNLN